MEWEELGTYQLESAQIFFPASLEIQEELLKAGFKVPYDKEKKISTPLPVISAFSKGTVIPKNRLLKAHEFEEDDKFVKIPNEEAHLKFLTNEKGYLTLEIELKRYHLEDLNFVSIPPRIWNAWVSFSLSAAFLDDILERLSKLRGETPKGIYIDSRGRSGREIEVYAYKGRKYKDLGIPVYAYYLGLNGLELAGEYFAEKADESSIDRDVLNFLKLGLKKSKSTRAGLKVGLIWKEGEPQRIALRLGTNYPRVKIRGLYGELEGKSRGELSYGERHFMTVRANDFYWALEKVKSVFGG
ncbi:hypothetical protein PAP_07670 [Palaeococcus pacificus DY20341]|uniref:PhoI n=1 Tax=Palaeococcus pacificus DY20341 TaxID=1343739 RepID=A0A075LZC8_9EURY|nr:hypothetical protein [Palaeococcus pacificus]AIF69923.1 hypothetical protein PAP_07670 [Palaeococcus pacificus DY20341]